MPASDGKTVYLLDVSYFTFRAYHALPPLNTSEGVPTNAVHGVANMLDKLVRVNGARYIAACFDSPGDTFRNEIYPDYKANRDDPDEDLKVQFPLVERLVRAMAIPAVRIQEYEADDLLATLAHRLSSQADEVVIVTGDKDLMQCVNERVSLYDPGKNKHFREPEVVEKFGVPPGAVTDVQGLMGDSTDNIPGVRGVGPKTAAALIGHFGSMAAMLERIEEIESLPIRGAKGVRKKVEEGRDAALLSKKLATVCVDAPVDLDLEDLRFDSPHTEELVSLAEELEMVNFAARIRAALGDAESGEAASSARTSDDGSGTSPTAAAADSATPAVEEPDDIFPVTWDKLDLSGEVAFVLYGDADEQPRLAISAAGSRALASGAAEITKFAKACAQAGGAPSGFDLKRLCREHGAKPGALSIDIGLASYLFDSSAGAHDLAGVADRFLKEAAAAPGPFAASMAASLEQVERLIPLMRERLTDHEQTALYADLELPLLAVLADIESRGIRLDIGLLAKLSDEFGKRMKELVERIYAAAGTEFNVLSPVQLRQVLFERLSLPTRGVKKTKTGLSTDSDTLEALSEHHELPALILDYRGLAKLRSTYVDQLPKLVDSKDRIHTSLNQTVTATGRLSSNDPNLQNIPIRTSDGAQIRKAFGTARGKVLLSADYNQIELRVLAHLSLDATLCESFRKGEDIHTATAAEVEGLDPSDVTAEMRRHAKVINYGIIYGMGAVRMARELKITRDEAAKYIERYFKRYSGVSKFYEQMREHARRHGYVATLMGRRRYLPDIDSDHGGRRQLAERVATNTPIQGSAADIIKLAMVNLYRDLEAEGLESAMVLQIHDELLLECPKAEVEAAERLTRRAMESAVSLEVPVVVDIGMGKNWAEAH